MPIRWKTLIATVALMGTTSSVAIAGGYESAGRSYAPAPKANWSGFYIGRHVGVGFQNDSDRSATVNGGHGGGGGGGGGGSNSPGGDGGNNGGGGGGGGGNITSSGGDGGDNAGGGGGGGGNSSSDGGDGGNNAGGGGGGGGNTDNGGGGGNTSGGGGGGGGNTSGGGDGGNTSGGGGGGGGNAADGGNGGDNTGGGGNGGGVSGGSGGPSGGGNGGNVNVNSSGGGGGGSGGGDGGNMTANLGGGGGGGSGGGDGGNKIGINGGGGGGGSGGGDGGNKAEVNGGAGGGGSGGGDGGNQTGINGGGGGGGSGGGDGGNASNRGAGGGGGGTGATVAARITSDDTNLLAGTHVGYNWQWHHTVLGVEGDYSANDNLDDYLASIRGRLGWATGNYLLYGTAGVAFAGRGGDDDAIGVAGGGGTGGNGGAGTLAGSDGGAGGSGGSGGIIRFGDKDDDETGWVAGGGVEAMLSPMAIVGLEALYYMIDGDNRNGNTSDDDFLAIRARLSAHLGGGAFSTAPTANWAGLYIGGNIGALFNQNDKIASVQLANGSAGGNGGSGSTVGGGGGGGGGGAAAIATLEDDSSVIGGAHGGFNWQNGHWVHGVEGDIGAVENTYEYVASLRGRLGWAYEQVLLYATAGLALAKDDSFDGTLFVGTGGNGTIGADAAAGGAGGPGGAGGVAFAANTGPSDNADLGFVIGAGTDVKLSHSLSLGMEGMYFFFDDGGNEPTINATTGNSVGSLDDDTEFGVVRARLTYHLGSQPLAPLK